MTVFVEVDYFSLGPAFVHYQSFIYISKLKEFLIQLYKFAFFLVIKNEDSKHMSQWRSTGPAL